MSQGFLLAYAAALIWLVVAAAGLRKETFKDRTNIDVSWRRTWKPAVLAPILAATGFALLSSTWTWQQRAVMWLISAAVLTPASFASGAITMAISRWHRRIEMRRRERSGLLPSSEHIEQARQDGRDQG